MQSFQHTLLILLLRLIRRKKPYTCHSLLMQTIKQHRISGPARPTEKMKHDLDVRHEIQSGCDVYTVSPKTARHSARRVLYLHGGAYVRPIAPQHWSFIRKFVMATGCRVTVPLYPLAPEASCRDAVGFVKGVYLGLSGEDPGRVSVMGDSAGGGLALALSLALKQDRKPMPERLILITPWVDVTVVHPRSEITERKDPMLAIRGLREAGRLYAGDRACRHPLVSPIYADLAGLPPMEVFVGTRDLLCHDALRFVDRARSFGCQVKLHSAEGSIHVYPLLPVPEAGKALSDMAALFR